MITGTDVHTVLVIDDDAFVREVIEMSFSSAGGWRPIMAESGIEGIRLAQELSPDVILLDLTMPDLDGNSTRELLVRNSGGREIPIVYLTADLRFARSFNNNHPGVVGIILKPFDPMTLPLQVTKMITAGATVSETQSAAVARTNGSQPAPIPDELEEALHQLWVSQRPHIMEQLNELSEYVASLHGTTFDADTLRESQVLAHNLIGLLGSLGLYRPCELARKIEREIRNIEAVMTGQLSQKVMRLTHELRCELAGEHPDAGR